MMFWGLGCSKKKLTHLEKQKLDGIYFSLILSCTENTSLSTRATTSPLSSSSQNRSLYRPSSLNSSQCPTSTIQEPHFIIKKTILTTYYSLTIEAEFIDKILCFYTKVIILFPFIG